MQAISYHIVSRRFGSACLKPDLTYRLNTLASEPVYVTSGEETGNYLRVNDNAFVTIPDLASTSGSIHVIDNVLRCPCIDASRFSAAELK